VSPPAVLPADGALVFIHIPKTAGTSLHDALVRQYPPSAQYQVRVPVAQSIERLRALPEERRAEIRALHGLMPFGLHELLPRPSVYAAMVRDPVARVVSHYNYVRRTPDHELRRVVDVDRVGLEDYVRAGIHALNNGQTRLLSGLHTVPFGEAPPEMLATARRNVDGRFAALGIAERFDESLVLYRRTLGWTRPLYYLRRNVSRGGPPPAEVPATTRAVIEEYNALDLELYAFARGRFEAQVAALGEPFRSEVEAFRRANRTVGRPYTFAGLVRRRLRRLAGLEPG
jgi:hypothetical protein